MMPGRGFAAAGSYRYGFNGKENDNEVKGEGNQQDYGMRIYDPRLGRFLSVDPLIYEYPELTPYQFASDRPIDGIDLDGLEFETAREIIQAEKAAQSQPNKDIIVYKQLSTSASCHGPRNSEFRVPGYSNPQPWSDWLKKNGLWQAVKTIDEASDYVPNPKSFVKRGWKYIAKKATKNAAETYIQHETGIPLSKKQLDDIKDFLKSTKKTLRYVLKRSDLDWRGTGKNYRDALDEAFKRTGVDKKDFEVTRWAKDKNGKSIPVEYRSKEGAEVSIDFAHDRNGPDAPHIGWQTPGKRSSGGAERGHILLDEVPAGR